MSALLRNGGAWGRNWRGWICREKRVESLFRRLQQHGWRDTVFVLGRPRLEFLRLKGKPYKIYESKSASGRGWLRILLGVFLVLVIVGVAAAGGIYLWLDHLAGEMPKDPNQREDGPPSIQSLDTYLPYCELGNQRRMAGQNPKLPPYGRNYDHCDVLLKHRSVRSYDLQAQEELSVLVGRHLLRPCLAPHFLDLRHRFFDGTDHIEGLLGESVMFTFHDLLEAANRIAQG